MNDKKRAAKIVDGLKLSKRAVKYFGQKGFFLLSIFSSSETIQIPVIQAEKLCVLKNKDNEFKEKLCKLLFRLFNDEVPVKVKDFDCVTIAVHGEGVVFFERPADMREDYKLNISFRKMTKPIEL